MKVRRRSALLAVVMYATTGLFAAATPLLSAPAAEAAPTAQFAFDYNNSQSSVTSMVDAIKKQGDSNAFQQSEVYATGGVPPIFGSGAEFTYLRHVTANDYQYAYDYTCVNGVPQTSPAASNVVSYTVELSIEMALNPNFYKVGGISSYEANVTHVTYNDAQVNGTVAVTHPDAHDVTGLSSNDSNIKGMHFPSSCIPSPFSYLDQAYKMNSAMPTSVINLEEEPAELAAWQPAINAAQADPGGASNAPPGSGGGGGGGGEDACGNVSFGLGWFLCPVIDLADNTIASMFQDIVLNSLKTEPLNQNDGGYGQNLHEVWSNVRTVADVAFVLIFLVITFANTLGFELDAYAIKTMIPKLVTAAILVQFSFVLCAAVLDVGNILGQGVASLLYTVAHTSNSGGGSTFENILGAIEVALIAVIVVSTVGALAVVIVVAAALAAVIGLLAVVVTLIIRKIIIAMVVVFSPLAFVAFVLPSTEKLFGTWLKNFLRTVMMYPMISAMFAIAAVLSSVTTDSSGGGGSFLNFQQLIAAAYPLITFFLIPLTFRWAGGLVNYSYGELNKLSSRASKKTYSGIAHGKLAESLRKSRQEKKEAKFDAANSAGGIKGWWAGARTRGAVFGQVRDKDGNRVDARLGRRGGKGLRGWQPTKRAGGEAMERRRLEQEHESLQHEAATNMALRRKAARQAELKVLMEPMEGQLKSDLHKQLQEIVNKRNRGEEVTHRDQMLATAIGMHLSKESAVDGSTLGMLRGVFRGDDEGFQGAVNEVRQANFGNFQKRLIPLFAAMGKRPQRTLPDGSKEDKDAIPSGEDLLKLDEKGNLTGVLNDGAVVSALGSVSADDLLSMDVDGRAVLKNLTTEDGRTTADLVGPEVKRRMLEPAYAGRIKGELSEILKLDDFAKEEKKRKDAEAAAAAATAGGGTGGGTPGGGGTAGGGATYTPPAGSSSTGGYTPPPPPSGPSTPTGGGESPPDEPPGT